MFTKKTNEVDTQDRESQFE